MKVLVFTSSYNRPYMLRQCILSVKNQSVKDVTHSVNITSEIENDYYMNLTEQDVREEIDMKNYFSQHEFIARETWPQDLYFWGIKK